MRDKISAGENPDDFFDVGFRTMRDLRRLKKEIKGNIETGKSQGHDVTDLETVMGEVTRAHDWVQDTLGGGSDD